MNAPLRREALTIQRLKSHFHGPATLDEARCAQWVDELAQADGEALTAGLVGPEEWLLIRYLPLALRWRQDASDADIAAQWQQALRQALQRAAARPDSPDFIRYPQRRAALADLLYRSALGETTRQWAWHRMELIPRDGLSPTEVLGHGLRVLLTEPALIWPVLHGLIQGEPATASLSAVLRVLPQGDWLSLLRASPRSAGYALSIAAAELALPAEATTADATNLLLEASDEVHSLLGWAESRSHFAARHAPVLSVLIAALAWPAATLTATQQTLRLRAVQAELRALLPATPARHPAAQDAQAGSTIPPTARAAELPPLPALPAADATHEWSPTRWAGALFWLGRLPATGMLDWLAAQQAAHIAAPSLALLLRSLGEALGIPPEDPALRAFCGGEVPRNETNEATRALAAEWAAMQVVAWSTWLDEAATDLPAPRLAAVCQRPGRLRFEAGWIELHLAMDQADTHIRRLGLDLDPGWLPWLGCVLRIVYDE